MVARSVNEQILDRLDQILRVLALQVAADRSVTEGAWTLKLAGIDNRTIAEVLNTTEATVRTLLRRQKTGSSTKKRRGL